MNNSHPSIEEDKPKKHLRKMLLNNFFKLVSWHLFKSFCKSDVITIFFAFHLAMLHEKKEQNFCSSQKKMCKSLTIFHVTITIPYSIFHVGMATIQNACCYLCFIRFLHSQESESRVNITQFYY